MSNYDVTVMSPVCKTFMVLVLGLCVTTLLLKAADDNAYLRYAHPTIHQPFVDLINLKVPQELENQRLAGLGYVDVTSKHFAADPSHWEGSTDPKLWHMLIDRPDKKTEFKLPPLERPVLYLRGTPVE